MPRRLRTASTSSRRAQLIPRRASRATGKSKYFEPPTDDEKDSSFEDADERSADSASVTSETDFDEPARKKAKVTPKKALSPKTAKKSPPKRKKKGGEEEEQPWETFIPKEATPEAGDVQYRDEGIHPSTLQFLKDLVKNNDREWFWSHEKRYRAAEKDFKTFVEALSNKLMEVDPTIPPLPIKDVIFRIYRDVRFSNDKTLYKNHFSAAWSRTGRKGPYAAYYIHIQPGNGSFIAGGKWQPDAGHLARIRHTIDRRPAKFKKPLLKPRFKKLFGGVDGLLTTEERLKTAPKGYPKDHPDIELLKLKSYRVVSPMFLDSEVTSERFLALCTEILGDMVEFIDMLNDVVMPDDDDSSDEDDESEDEEDEEEQEQ